MLPLVGVTGQIYSFLLDVLRASHARKQIKTTNLRTQNTKKTKTTKAQPNKQQQQKTHISNKHKHKN